MSNITVGDNPSSATPSIATASVNDASSPAPVPPRFEPDAYYGLLTNPPGRYGRAKWGASSVVTLRGSAQFRECAINLFSSFAPPSRRLPQGGARFESISTNNVTVHDSDHADCQYFCMSPERVLKALETYFYCQAARAKGLREERRDADGDFIEYGELTNAADIEQESKELAASFVEHYMTSDYGAVPDELSPYGRGLDIYSAVTSRRSGGRQNNA